MLLACLGALGACVEDVPRSVRLIIRADVNVPSQVDAIAVQYVAARNTAGDTCTPRAEQVFSLPATDLPLIVDLFPGATYGAWVGYRVRWMLGSDEISHFTGRTTFPSSGATEIPLTVVPACVPVDCAADANCVDGACLPFVGGDPFDPALRDPSAQDCVLRLD